MNLPNIKGYKLKAEIGRGVAGTVFEAIRGDGMRVAIKVFDGMSSNSQLIANQKQRVVENSAENVTVPILWDSLHSRPAYIVMPFLGQAQETGQQRFVADTLQTHLADYLGTEKTWPLIIKLATRLALLHSARVAHGNLKPGNIFFDEERHPLLSDYASGLMPEVHHLGFSDALLYTPPEQLRNPQGYTNEKGYQWDVFAFGVLSFRLLTGKFPRCQSVFETGCPVSGDQPKNKIEIEHEEIAARLEEESKFIWPTDAGDLREEKIREIIDFCLTLDPMGRPSDMREVARHLHRIEEEAVIASEKLLLVQQAKKSEERRSFANLLTTIMAVITLALGAMWGWTQNQRTQENRFAAANLKSSRDRAAKEISSLQSDFFKAQKSESDAVAISNQLRAALTHEQQSALEELRSSHQISGNLFDWIMEAGVVGLPTLEGRRGRLLLLEEELIKQLEGLEVRTGLEKYAALLRLKIAEIQLATGQLNEGFRSLQNALIKGRGDLDPSQELKARLRLILLQSEKKEALETAQLNAIIVLIQRLHKKEDDGFLRASSAVELAKGRDFERQNKLNLACQSFKKSFLALEELAKRYPETPALRMGLGRAYQEAALCAENTGDPNHTAELRGKAAKAFQELASNPETTSPELEFQLASASAAQAVSAWQSGRSFTAEKLAKAGIAKLTALQAQRPDDFGITVALASQQGIVATTLRDSGQSTAAKNLLERSISSLESGLRGERADWSARYLLASLKWQLSGIYRQRGEGAEEVRIGTEARDELKLILDAQTRAPHPDRVKESLAYLCGELGHSADRNGKRSLGVAFLKESRMNWNSLLTKNPQSTEARDGLSWTKRRLHEMGVK